MLGGQIFINRTRHHRASRLSRRRGTPINTLLSIVIPTLNRATLLGQLLDRLAREVEWLPAERRERVEVVVGDNASDDATQATVAPMREHNWFRAVRFENRVCGDDSIARTVDLAQGRFVWVFGDDDALADGFLRPVVERLIAQPDHVLYYYNRLLLNADFTHVVRIAHIDWPSEYEEMPLGEFIRRFTHWPCFITSVIFPKERFQAGKAFAVERYAGWTQVARLFFVPTHGTVSVGYYPLVVQRLGVQSWKGDWPQYWLINMPTMLADLENVGITSGAVEQWLRHEVTYYRVAADVLVAKAYGLDWRNPFWLGVIRWQRGGKRLMIRIAQFCLPCRFAKVLYCLLQKRYR